MNIGIADQITFLAFWISFARWGTTLIQTPLLEDGEVPGIVRLLLVFMVTFAFFDSVKSPIIEDLKSVGEEHYIVIFLFYLITGLIIGLFLKSIMHVFASAGNIITQNIGFSTSKFFDPTLSSYISPLEKLIQWTIILIIINSGALVPIFRGILSSFHKFSYSHFQNGFFSTPYMVDFFKELFSSSIILAFPLIMLNLILQIILAIAGRIMPQMNIFALSLITNISLGVVVLYLAGDEFFIKAFEIYKHFLQQWYSINT